ncbi:MAG: glutamate-semialdehyde -aminomutase [Fimbriimonadaceae bacterium]|jgi:glutamate-1-semialdehyde 2,1-aminomutase|nr:glutamate-semialdehyde -aminomutase [Fimbriimonadaceae bacterium]
MASTPAVDHRQHLERIHARYAKSREMLERAQQTIPLGSQTFSKSHIQFPTGAAPHFLDKGKGSHVWDVDGNEYVDFVNGLLPVILGYGDPDVDDAVQKQLRRGVSFSLATELEIELAELLVKHIPCAEKVRFGKNGTDATSAAVRLSRAFTGKDRVAVCGYHGWQDWYIGSTLRFKGVPDAVRDLTHTFTYNDLSSLQRILQEHPNEFSCVVMEPMTVTYPRPGFLQGVAELTHKHGVLLVFDEIITGFRFSLGGAQEMFGVKPDLATFGKSMGNGYPISAIVGRSDVMDEMEEIFFSGTFGGEALSLAATIATIKKMEREPVLQHLHKVGEQITASVNDLLKKHRLEDCVSISGHPSWTLLSFKDTAKATLWEIKSLYLQEVIARGILTGGSHNTSFSHTDEDLAQLERAQDEAFAIIREAIDSGDIRSFLVGKPIEPLFRVR